MLVLIIFAFLGGIVTILSPCILPVLPLVLSGSVTGGKKRPFGIATGFILSFTVFTLFLTYLVRLTGLSADLLRTLAAIIIIIFSITIIIPQAQFFIERLLSKLSRKATPDAKSTGFSGGLLIGSSLGLVWTPCVGPILASVISLALTESINGAAVFITIAYAMGTAIPMLAIIYGGRQLLNKIPWLVRNTSRIQKAFGVLMLLVAIGILFNVDRNFQNYLLDKFPGYGKRLIKTEENGRVLKELHILNKR